MGVLGGRWLRIFGTWTGKFFERGGRLRILTLMAWSRRELAVTYRAQGPADYRVLRSDVELIMDPYYEIAQAPPHHPIEVRSRPRLDQLGQGLSLA